MLLARCPSRSIRPTRRHTSTLLTSHNPPLTRSILTLAIETSCDDTSVALLSKPPPSSLPPNAAQATLLFHSKLTANNHLYQGIHPLHSVESHELHLSGLIQRALHHLPRAQSDDPLTTFTLPSPNGDGDGGAIRYTKPTFIAATRGPGMRSALATGLGAAKGLALGLAVPLVGVHHMQAHLLTPRLCGALAPEKTAPNTSAESTTPDREREREGGREGIHQPAFPLLTLLVSGGHTLLLHSTGLAAHAQLATTADIAAGDCVDKIARMILPPALLSAHTSDTNYGRLLERFAFPPSELASTTRSPKSGPSYPSAAHAEHCKQRWGWTLPTPLESTRAGHRSGKMAFSFSGICSAVRRVVETGTGYLSESRGAVRTEEMGEEERRDLAVEGMRVVFEMVAGRVVRGYESVEWGAEGGDVVLSGGVAANGFLRHILREAFASRNLYPRFHVPPPSLCTDNAAMIAWAGVEMWEAGWESELGVTALRKWPMGEGAILGAEGWKRREGFSER